MTVGGKFGCLLGSLEFAAAGRLVSMSGLTCCRRGSVDGAGVALPSATFKIGGGTFRIGGRNSGASSLDFKWWRLFRLSSPSSWRMMYERGLPCFDVTMAGSHTPWRRCRTTSPGWSKLSGGPAFLSYAGLYWIWRSRSTAAVPEGSTTCGFNRSALVCSFDRNIRLIASWAGECFIPDTGVYRYSRRAMYGSFPESSAFFMSCLTMETVDIGLAVTLGKSRTWCSNSNTPAVGKVDECTAVEWLVVSIYKRWYSMSRTDTFDMCDDTLGSLIFDSSKFWILRIAIHCYQVVTASVCQYIHGNVLEWAVWNWMWNEWFLAIAACESKTRRTSFNHVTDVTVDSQPVYDSSRPRSRFVDSLMTFVKNFEKFLPYCGWYNQPLSCIY